ncbi:MULTISPECIES: helix-turn-helix domain-containing protein [Pseudomonas]|jgi:DNA-binding transcriptional MerR regulator|uniref:Transcriptional regulator n=1 Tax=Pseudomonas lundensis TaxID=86185 RepID=A0AAX2HBX0_9PSED|nr:MULTISPECIES: helix-turn-helix domain-containing protein [Pseudomonas]AOZ14901.1 transcriptional regulator [Pseudomonas lundensis]MBM1184862.1 helix-turn-helix domain-containing protein [Pseudomonas lundensis]NMZ56978.1 helix-turn-helix domain-containing protein [Pseudomonas lundensis]NNA14142.1 helix-turn-helix domain-containing protein [Pseudomonas lundensis]NNA27897.1 helix-turn-helix domain-containing protein [Pseudomonas lundensis]
MKEFGIREVARRSGVPASTLRYYEEKGLIRSAGRRGLSRVFKADVLDQLALITFAQSLTFSLEEIAPMLTANGHVTLDRQLLTRKADELDRLMAKLAAVRDELRSAAACPARSHGQCPSFQQRLKDVSREDVWQAPFGF